MLRIYKTYKSIGKNNIKYYFTIIDIKNYIEYVKSECFIAIKAINFISINIYIYLTYTMLKNIYFIL
jgi:hypothetical protein